LIVAAANKTKQKPASAGFLFECPPAVMHEEVLMENRQTAHDDFH
jgi:hypothetical protein